jgi:hypothetical protein
MVKKTENHMKAPKCASFVANMRQLFTNAEVTVTKVKENEVEIGAYYDPPALTHEQVWAKKS